MRLRFFAFALKSAEFLDRFFTMSASKTGRAITEMKARRLSAPARSKAVRRPDDIIRDVRGLKLRQRVSLVLNDKVLREELEDIVDNFVHNGPRPGSEGIRTYQDFLVPSYGGGMGGGMVMPIADIRGSDTLNYSKQERLLRCKLAAVYRLVDLFGWSIGIYGHVTVRASSEEEHYLLNPFGLLYSEITASSLVKVDYDGNIIDGGSTSLGVNRAGLTLHSAIHAARKDIKCVIHIHQAACVAVAATGLGILPISQEAAILGEISYHDYCGILVDEEEKQSIGKDLGEKSKVMVLRNHGIVACGETIDEAFNLAYLTVRACESQVRAMAAGIDNLIKIDEQARQQVTQVAGGDNITDSSKSIWKNGELEFEAWMRMLDARGYRTGFVYKNPDIYVSEKARARDVTSPATTTSTRAQLFFTPVGENAPKRSHSTGRANTYRNRLKWLNTPVKGTEYKKEEDQAPVENKESIIIEDLEPEKKDKEKVKEVKMADDFIIQTSNVHVQESSPDMEKGAFDEEDREGVVHKREVKQTTVVVTRVVDKDGERKEETKVTENKQLFIDGKEVEALKPPVEDEEQEGEEHSDHKEEAEGEGSSPTGESPESPEPDSPTKPGQKVKKKKSFKDALKKKFSKRGKDDHHEETKKPEEAKQAE